MFFFLAKCLGNGLSNLNLFLAIGEKMSLAKVGELICSKSGNIGRGTFKLLGTMEMSFELSIC